MKNAFRFLFGALVILFSLPVFCQVDFSASQVKGCDSLSVRFTLLTGLSSPKVRWNFGNGKTSQEIDPAPVAYQKPGSYTVTVTVNDTIIRKKTGYVQVRPSPVASFQYTDSSVPGTYIFAFHSLQQPVDTALYFYQWKFPGQTLYDTTPDVVHIFDSTGLYRVFLRVTDDFGCADSSIRLVYVGESLYVPNVFTPNEDGLNDLLEIPVSGEVMYRLSIFTRYGLLVYKTESKFPSWDGRNAAGVKMTEGIYYYIIESLDQQHPAHKAGFVYLLR
ncbi:MAG TPA: gliding motility-associated C-terminal domain-containing protein [Bacteroidales bacterium]|nr:gliding motility-associated C-terminal domain-containing protein [Bacteroidales bacterium]